MESRGEKNIKSVSQAGGQNCVGTMSGRRIYKVMGFQGRIFLSAFILSVYEEVCVFLDVVSAYLLNLLLFIACVMEIWEELNFVKK